MSMEVQGFGEDGTQHEKISETMFHETSTTIEIEITVGTTVV